MLNPAIEKARRVALDILKPSERDLDHGLAIHRDALVFESYSLGLRAPTNPQVVNAAFDAGASSGEIQDLIGEQSALGWASTDELRQEYREAFEASGVSCLCINAGEEGNDPLRLIKRLARFSFLPEAMPETLARVTSPAEIETARRAGKRSLYLTTNGVPLTGRQLSVEDELGLVSTFAQLGVRMMHLTYNRRNPMADGCGETSNAGISDFGRAVVAEMNRCGLMIDLAHTGWQSCLEAARASDQPVVVSHASVHALNPHVRSKPDEVIRAVLATGGTIGITNIPEFLGRTGDIAALLDHVDHMVRRFGADSVTIGTDSPYRARGEAAALNGLKKRPRARTKWESLWPEGFAASRQQWKKSREAESLAWTNWPLFTVGLVQRGHSDDTIRKIVGGNMMRVANAVWSRSSLLERKADPSPSLPAL